MRQYFENIEYNRFHGHKYLVGYAPLSSVWHVHRSGRGWWCAVAQRPELTCGVKAFYAHTLAEVSAELRVR